MQFSKIAAVLSLAAVAVAAPAPVAAPEAALEVRTAGNACKVGNSFTVIGGGCEQGNTYTCSANGLVNVLNIECINVLNGNKVIVDIKDVAVVLQVLLGILKVL
ncbi:hypothetical protein GJ744_012176 [Endocarpon pusillum]|uniref:Hydrophobin n=1 Tax=Endocarpon pusillum TaxID=364733 RepID=A0A8H7AFL0_9EURO|nr:hypothetical protein GJ744_012176 [Endocarpon pusillum]